MKLRKLLALAMAAVLAVSSASVAVAAELSVKSEAELKNALSSATTGDVITLANDITVEDQIVITNDIILEGNGNTLNVMKVDDSGKSGGAVVVENADVTFNDVTFRGSTEKKNRYVVHCYLSTVEFNDCEVENGNYSAVYVNGSDVTFNNTTVDSASSYDADVEFGMGNGVTTKPKLTINGGNVGNLYADKDSLNRMGIPYTEKAEEVDRVLEALKGFIDSDTDVNVLLGVEGDAPNSGEMAATNPDPVTPPSDNNSNRSDNDDDSDYFGNETWDEVKREIAEAEEGDTIKVSATGLPYFPSSVARALKGLDITLEIRKNGVTYEVNGLEIGDIDKIWYEFDELETELLTADADSEAPAAEDEEAKPIPDTGR